LYARSPYNAVRLILNRDKDPHAEASRELRAWLKDGILRTDPEAAFYFYAQTFEVAGRGVLTRDGIIGAMRLEEFGSGHVCPHERTMEAPKADRLRLLEACRANLSAIFGVVSRPDLTLRDVVGAAAAGPPEVDLRDDAGVQHRLWRIGDPAVQRACAGFVRDQPVVIADGHHRYETALEYRNRMRRAHPDAGADAPFEFVLTCISNTEEPGLVVLPTHRILPKVRPADVRNTIAALGEVFEAIAYRTAERQAFLAELGRHELRIGCALADELVLLTLRGDPARLLARTAPALRRLGVVILHELVLSRLAGTDPAEIVYTHDDGEALAAVAGARAGAAFLVRAPTPQEMRAACLAGETMPQKSTYFYPKLLTGLVFRSLD
jgi:uncharacterized protein (DUF1015 family)